MTFQTVDAAGKPGEPLTTDCNAIAPANDVFEFKFQQGKAVVDFRMTRAIVNNLWTALNQVMSGNPEP